MSDREPFSDPTDIPEQIDEALKVPLNDMPRRSKVCICGIGASAVAGEIMSDFADTSSDIPIPVVRGMDLPKWADGDTVTILMSYGGNTPEILSLYDQAKLRGCGIICITSGGGLMEMALADGNTLIKMPSGLMPRRALGYMLGFTASVLEEMGVCASRTELNSMLPSLISFRDSVIADEENNEAYTIAKAIDGRTPVIYSLVNLRSAAIRWKMQINENPRMIAFYGTIPEFNHNEIIGWTESQAADEFIPIILRDEDSTEVLNCIMETLSGVLDSSGIKPYEFVAKGSSDLEKNLVAIIMGDIVSIYLAYLKDIYPGKIDIRHADGSNREFS